MINRSILLAALLAFAGLVVGSASSSAQEIYSSCPLGAEQFGGRCTNGHYYAPRQGVDRQAPPRVVYYQQPRVIYTQPMPEQRYVVVQRHEDGGERMIGLFAQVLGAMLRNH